MITPHGSLRDTDEDISTHSGHLNSGSVVYNHEAPASLLARSASGGGGDASVKAGGRYASGVHLHTLLEEERDLAPVHPSGVVPIGLDGPQPSTQRSAPSPRQPSRLGELRDAGSAGGASDAGGSAPEASKEERGLGAADPHGASGADTRTRKGQGLYLQIQKQGNTGGQGAVPKGS